MPLCKHCGLEKPPKDFAKNKWNADGSGLSVYCRDCIRGDSAVKHAHEKAQKLAWHYRFPDTRWLRDLNADRRVVRADLLEQKQAQAVIAAQLVVLYSETPAECERCHETKSLLSFPKMRYAPLDHSAVCSDCWALDPDKKAGLQRERMRYYGRAMRDGNHERSVISFRHKRSDIGRPREELREKYRQRRERDDTLRDYASFGFTRYGWGQLTAEQRSAFRIERLKNQEVGH